MHMTRYTESVDVAIMDQHHRRWCAHRMRPVIPSTPIEALQAPFCPRKPSRTPCRKTPTSRYPVLRTRRICSAQFKDELIATCQQPGAAIAATTRQHVMNAKCAASLAQGASPGPAPVCLQYDASSCAQQGWTR